MRLCLVSVSSLPGCCLARLQCPRKATSLAVRVWTFATISHFNITNFIFPKAVIDLSSSPPPPALEEAGLFVPDSPNSYEPSASTRMSRDVREDSEEVEDENEAASQLWESEPSDEVVRINNEYDSDKDDVPWPFSPLSDSQSPVSQNLDRCSTTSCIGDFHSEGSDNEETYIDRTDQDSYERETAEVDSLALQEELDDESEEESEAELEPEPEQQLEDLAGNQEYDDAISAPAESVQGESLLDPKEEDGPDTVENATDEPALTTGAAVAGMASTPTTLTTEEMAELANILAVCPPAPAGLGSSYHAWAKVRWASWSLADRVFYAVSSRSSHD